MTGTEKAYWRRQRRIRRQTSGRWGLTAVVPVVVCVVLVVVLAVGCQAGDWFRMNGNPTRVDGPGQLTEMTGIHADVQTKSAYDDLCALVGGCPFWSSPKVFWWRLPVYHDFLGGRWVQTVGNWELYLVCEVYESLERDVRCDDPSVAGVRG